MSNKKKNLLDSKHASHPAKQPPPAHHDRQFLPPRRMFGWRGGFQRRIAGKKSLAIFCLIVSLTLGAWGAGSVANEPTKEGGWGILSGISQLFGLTESESETDLSKSANPPNPSMQLSKEYIYAGSRMLAIEDYGLASATPSPTPTLTPTPTPTPVLKPDLVISNFTINPASPIDGDQVTFSVTVTNQGTGTMSGFLGVRYQIDGGCPSGGCPSHAVSSITIAPSQSATLNGASGTWAAVAGSHTLSAQVDDVSAIDESDEMNNVATLNINVNPPPTPTPTPTPAPAVPSIAGVTQNADPTCLDITLNGVSGADSYNVKILNSGYTINVTGLSFPWCGLAPSTYYEYQAQSVNQYGTSGWSGTVGGTTANPPPTPTPTPPPPTPTPCNAPRKIQDECRRDGGVWDDVTCDCLFPERGGNK